MTNMKRHNNFASGWRGQQQRFLSELQFQALIECSTADKMAKLGSVYLADHQTFAGGATESTRYRACADLRASVQARAANSDQV
jgi:hypothetical protein